MLGLLIGKKRADDDEDVKSPKGSEGTKVAAKAILEAIDAKDADKLSEALEAFITLAQD